MINRAEKKILTRRERVKRGDLFSPGYIKKLQEGFKKDDYYMARFQWCVSHTPPAGWYRVTGPAHFGSKRLDGKAWVTCKVDNDMLGKIVRPRLPVLGNFVTFGHVHFECLAIAGKYVRRERVSCLADVELEALSKSKKNTEMKQGDFFAQLGGF